MITGFCFSPYIDNWTPEGLRALHSFGFTHCRVSIDLAGLCKAGPNPQTWAWDRLGRFMSDLRTAGLVPYLNPSGAPRWASGGFPAYEGLIVGNPDGTLGGTSMWDYPGADPNHIHYFDQTPGSPFYEIDIKEPARPYLLDPPMIDLQFMRTVGRELTARYRPEFIGWGNEFGGEMFNPWVRIDVARDGKRDMIQEFIAPAVRAFFDGVSDGWITLVSSAITNFGIDVWKRVGPDADSDGIMQRCADAGLRYDILAGHFYGDADLRGGEELGYATTQSFFDVADAEHRPLWCSEVAAPLDRLLPWFKRVTSQYSDRLPAIFLLGQPWMPIPTIDPARTDIAAFVAAFAEINGPVKVAGADVGHRKIGQRRA